MSHISKKSEKHLMTPKKLLSIFLVIALVIGLFPSISLMGLEKTAFAGADEQATVAGDNTASADDNALPSDQSASLEAGEATGEEGSTEGEVTPGEGTDTPGEDTDTPGSEEAEGSAADQAADSQSQSLTSEATPALTTVAATTTDPETGATGTACSTQDELQTCLTNGTDCYLSADITTTSALTSNVNCTMDLNGHVINRNLSSATKGGYVLGLGGSATFTLNIIDSNPSAVHKFNKVSAPTDIYKYQYDTSGSISVNGGCITGGFGLTKNDDAGGIYVKNGSSVLSVDKF